MEQIANALDSAVVARFWEHRDDQMGHEDGSVQARYAHITSGMIERLLDGLTGLWTAALEGRRAINPRSPVAVLDRLLGECGE
ncbi:hypothetical protein AB0C29_02885 [Actinoplanes sp. NPDC048791]|uniref:hypothetical protein n=1 Tax=Actinoplanes sp. NPDC048791 TaxID=3154623 RepID=UPI0033F963E8